MMIEIAEVVILGKSPPTYVLKQYAYGLTFFWDGYGIWRLDANRVCPYYSKDDVNVAAMTAINVGPDL